MSSTRRSTSGIFHQERFCSAPEFEGEAINGLAAAVKRELSGFGANVRRERNTRNLTQERLAELADLNIRTIQKIEAGKLNVLITTAMRLQRALNCSWDRLFP